MKVRNLMHKGVACVAPVTSVLEIAQMMREADIGAIPVVENNHLVGIVTDRDIICRAFAETRYLTFLTASHVMTSPIICCRADDDVEDAIAVMEHNKVRRLPVIDESDRMVGMLSLSDISHWVPQGLAAKEAAPSSQFAFSPNVDPTKKIA